MSQRRLHLYKDPTKALGLSDIIGSKIRDRLGNKGEVTIDWMLCQTVAWWVI